MSEKGVPDPTETWDSCVDISFSMGIQFFFFFFLWVGGLSFSLIIGMRLEFWKLGVGLGI